ncbi:hypothetical protein OS493_027947 [Desmophyllum pertusum]|uniref:Tetratricopeptide repeat protein n=1 Tax=Desmophyllum pertusum TaxID=174260 RepID=A0A9W9YCJ6_9CNID|nr:hypothetical protein OS493_027947 [Desmophyllum pertusum]
MDNVEEILQALFIGIAVASVLFQTYRYSKAIELFSECLVFLKKHSTKLKKEKLNELYALVYRRLFSLYCFVGDYKNAIQSGEKAFLLYHQIGDNERAAALLDKIGDVYQLTGKQVNAKEIYEKACALYYDEIVKVSEIQFVKQREHFERMLSVATKIGDKEIVGGLLHKLGDLSLSLFEYPQTKDYFQRELAIWKETGNRKNEGRTLISLGNVYRNMEEYKQAKQHYEEAMVILEEASEIIDLGVTYRNLAGLHTSLDIPTKGLSILDWLEKLEFQLLLQGERCEDRSLFQWTRQDLQHKFKKYPPLAKSQSKRKKDKRTIGR